MRDVHYQRAAVGTSIVAFAAVVVIIVSLAGVLFVISQPRAPGQSPSTSSGRGINSLTIYSNTTQGLRLTATVRPVNAPEGQNITVTARVHNTLSTTNEANTTSMTDPAYGPCQQGLATGVRVYQGNYVFANLSKAKELLLYNPSLIYTCPAVFTFRYSFSPNSDVATVQPTLGAFQEKNETHPINETSVLSGYWTGSGQNYAFQSFPQGSYTIVVFDAWGQKAVGHFQITSKNGSSSASSNTPPTGGTYEVTFQQIGACSPTFWGIPWSVTIGNTTDVQPPNTKLPIDNSTLYGASNKTFTTITFALANGTYHYRVSPSAGFFTPSSGSVTVAGSNVMVRIAYTGTSCVTTKGTASTGSNGTLTAECSQAPRPSSGFGEVVAGTSSPAIICLQLYYYSSAAPLTLNLTDAISIQALQYIYNGSIGYARSFNGDSNFTITTGQSQLEIGGPANENEGTVVAIAVTARTGASGTYQLSFLPSSSLNTWMLTSQEPEQCGYYGQLVAGNGQPNYAQITHCITYTTTSASNSTTTTSSSNYHTLQGVPYPLINGDLYFRVISVTDSTG